MIRIFIFCMFLLTTFNSKAAEWKYFYSEDDADYYYDVSSLTYDSGENSFTVWVWQNYPKSHYDSAVEKYVKSNLFKFIFFCDIAQYKFLQGQIIYENDMKLNVNGNKPFYPVPKDGDINQLFHKLCF